MRLFDNLLFGALILCLCGLLATNYIVMEKYRDENYDTYNRMNVLIDKVNTLKMYNEDLKNLTAASGLYFTPSYYCVWTENRTTEEINETDIHEQSHDVVFKEKEHFCGKKNITEVENGNKSS